MNMLKGLCLVLFMLAAALLDTRAGINEAGPVSYNSNAPVIVGWNWVRSTGQFAEWEFAPVAGPVRNAVISFTTLSTNTMNGGAGYDSKLKVVSGGAGVVMLHNDCPGIRYSGNSGGIGYQSHGCMKVRLEPGQPLKIRLEYPGTGAHSATKRESAKLIYVN
jgi:hypothetical protein